MSRHVTSSDAHTTQDVESMGRIVGKGRARTTLAVLLRGGQLKIVGGWVYSKQQCASRSSHAADTVYRMPGESKTGR